MVILQVELLDFRFRILSNINPSTCRKNQIKEIKIEFKERKYVYIKKNQVSNLFFIIANPISKVIYFIDWWIDAQESSMIWKPF